MCGVCVCMCGVCVCVVCVYVCVVCVYVWCVCMYVWCVCMCGVCVCMCGVCVCMCGVCVCVCVCTCKHTCLCVRACVQSSFFYIDAEVPLWYPTGYLITMSVGTGDCCIAHIPGPPLVNTQTQFLETLKIFSSVNKQLIDLWIHS